MVLNYLGILSWRYFGLVHPQSYRIIFNDIAGFFLCRGLSKENVLATFWRRKPQKKNSSVLYRQHVIRALCTILNVLVIFFWI